MFGFWYITIGLLVPTLIFVILAIVKRDDWNVEWYIGCAVAFGILATFCAILSICIPIAGKHEVEYFKHQSEYVATAVENGSDLENIAITQTIIEQNEWLAKAKAGLAVWGTWSMYYGTGVEELEPITINRK